jgi:hypothetical protein
VSTCLLGIAGLSLQDGELAQQQRAVGRGAQRLRICGSGLVNLARRSRRARPRNRFVHGAEAERLDPRRKVERRVGFLRRLEGADRLAGATELDEREAFPDQR